MIESQGKCFRIMAVDDERQALELYRQVLCPDKEITKLDAEIEELEAKLTGESITKPSDIEFDLTLCHQSDEAIEEFRKAVNEGKPFSVVFLDERMPPGPNGVWAAEHIRMLDPNVQIVMATAYSDVDPMDIAVRVPPLDKLLYLQKPIFPQEIRHFASACSAKWEAEKLLLQAQSDLEVRIQERTKELSRKNEQLTQEISRRKRMESETRVSEERFRALFHSMSNCVAVYEPKDDGKDFVFVDLNKAAEKTENIKKEDIITKSVIETFPGVKILGLFDVFQRVWATGKPEHHPIAFYKDNRINGWRENYVYKLPSGEIVAIYNDVTDQKRAEESLKESEEKYRQLFENESDAVMVFDLETMRFEDANQATLDLYGYSKEEFLRLKVEDISAEKEKTRISIGGIRENGVVGPQFVPVRSFKKKDGAVFPGEISAGLFISGDRKKVIGAVRDITERIRAEEEKKEYEAKLRQAQKMEAIGTLAGGIAHDFNNLLTAITGRTELALMKTRGNNKAQKDLNEIGLAANRAAELTQQLLAYSRKQFLRTETLDLNEILHDINKMLRRLIREDIDLSIDPSTELWPTFADRGQIEQVIVNLVVNARDALPEGGRIVLETSNYEMSRDNGQSNDFLEAGPYVIMKVKDNGHGMNDETMKHIFEPFFTTKPVGEGTGLGLATVYGIVKQHGGDIEVTSQEEQGTAFTIYLPASKETQIPKKSTKQEQSLPNGAGTILFVEDDNNIRVLATEILSQLGYSIYVAANGIEALKFLDENPVSPDLLITDIIMPQMNGEELAERFENQFPNGKVLFVSGYTDKAFKNGKALKPGAELLEKPFTAMDLAKKVSQILAK